MNLFHRFQNQIIPSILITGMVLAGTASPDASAEGLLGDSSLLDRIESRAAEREEVLNGLHDMADQVAGQIEEHHADREERISSAIDDLMGAMSSAEKALEDLIKATVSGEEISWTDQRLKWDSILKATSKIVGIPFENVENIANALIYQTTRWFSGEFVGGYQMLRFTTSPNTSAGRAKYFDNLYRAYRNDPKAFKELYGMMIESGDFDEDGIKSAMESRMKKNEGVSSVKELSARFEAP